MTGTRHARSAPPRDRRGLARLIGASLAVACVVLLIVGVLGRLTSTPAHVERITFENPTPYDLTVDVTNSQREGWTTVGTARRRAATTADEVVDQGDSWIFRFSGQGEHAGELRLRRADLERSRWTVVIPARIGEQLRARGAPPSP